MTLVVQQVLQWWIVLFFVGIIALPLTATLFHNFFDKGYAFSKTIGIILISYLALILGTIHILPFVTLSLFCIAGFVIICSIVLIKKMNLFHELKAMWKLFLFEELLFSICLFFWSFIKGFQPDIHGLEKFMDYGFVNSILRTTYFPPKDMWMTPLSINYYYFGHLETSVLTKLSFLPSTITFNLMLATLFALTFLGSFSLAGNLLSFFWTNIHEKKNNTKILAFSLVTAFLLTMGGNLHTIYTLFTPYQNDAPANPFTLTFSPQTFPNQYWYPNATRFIHNTIHEFPGYSFVVSDLHGHVLDIPNVLLMIGLLLLVFMETPENDKKLLFQTVAMGGLAGILYMTNAWDGLIYTGAAGALLLFKLHKKKHANKYLMKESFFFLIILIVSFFIAGFPFSLFFKPFASQIGLNCAPEFLLRMGHIGPLIFERGFCQHSFFWQLGILYGFFFFWFVSFLLFLFIKGKQQIQTVDTFIVGLGLLGFALIIVPEFVYLKDIYTTYFRANTMFKLVYQSFILLSLVSGYSIYRILSSLNAMKKQWRLKIFSAFYITVSTVLLAFVAIYPYFAITSYFNGLKTFQGLDGSVYLQTLYPDDYRAIQWINKNIAGQPVMLEAQGDSYTDYERISSNTGLPTVFGWMVHEWLWRGTYDIVPERIADVKNLYESHDIEQTKKLIQKYHVQYIYIGSMERKKYADLYEEKFKKIGTVMYASGTVIIYKIL